MSDALAKDIKQLLDKEDYDDGSLGPLFVRLAWHASGTYSKYTKTGGSNGATMRFNPEMSDGANAGLGIARNFLEPLRQKHNISYADLWTFAGVISIEAMNGPKIPWKKGRQDISQEVKDISQSGFVIPQNGRLPDAAQGGQHIRDVFYRMGFNDQEIVCLSGAHSLGRCHRDRSGFDGPWTHTPTRFSNQYFKLLKSIDWKPRQWDGPKQFTDPDNELMMLPSDMALLWDPKFRPYVDLYAEDKDLFFKDFALAFGKLLELGVPRGKF